jgi:single-strand DNA-binding protein
MFNRVILIGNLTKDPDVRYTAAGTAVATIRIAVSSKFRQADEQKEETLFIDVVTFGKQAEVCGQYLNKGNPVLVEGRLRERKWETEGVQKSKFEVLANTVRFLPRREQRPLRGDEESSDMPPPEETTDLEPF